MEKMVEHYNDLTHQILNRYKNHRTLFLRMQAAALPANCEVFYGL